MRLKKDDVANATGKGLKALLRNQRQLLSRRELFEWFLDLVFR